MLHTEQAMFRKFLSRPHRINVVACCFPISPLPHFYTLLFSCTLIYLIWFSTSNCVVFCLTKCSMNKSQENCDWHLTKNNISVALKWFIVEYHVILKLGIRKLLKYDRVLFEYGLYILVCYLNYKSVSK